MPRRTQRLIDPIRAFLATETAGSVLMVAATAVALLWANSPWRQSYTDLWRTSAGIDLGGHELRMDLGHWVGDGLMTLFFLLVGLEIKRELVLGELRDRRRAALPAAAALGGVIVPAALFAAFTAGGTGAPGWAIPAATDIAMALGVLRLVGARRVPQSLVVFLLALAIVDDLITIVILTVFYSSGISLGWLGAGVALVGGLVAMRQRRGARDLALRRRRRRPVARLACRRRPRHPRRGDRRPARPDQCRAVQRRGRRGRTARRLDRHRGEHHCPPSRRSVSVVERVEHALHPWTSFLVVPLFALANAGIRFDGALLDGIGSSSVVHGILAGSVVGKPVGILLASWLAIRFGLARLPADVCWAQIAAVSTLGGIGFTVAIFIANGSFDDPLLIGQAKLAILLAALTSAVVGSIAVRRATRPVVRS